MNIEPTQAQQNGILYQVRQKYGPTCDTDLYKLSHAPQYPDNSDIMVSYLEARGGKRDKVLNHGAEMIAQEYLLQRLTQQQANNMIQWANTVMNGNMVDNLKIALDAVVNELGGRMPIKIRNVKEGALVPINNVLLTIENTIADRRFFSLVSYFETKLVRVWSPTTVATTSYYVRQDILKSLEQSCDDPMAVINFMFVDFGSRGVGGMEVAAFAGSGHLISFMATDTSVAIMAIEMAHDMVAAGFSIPASEHSSTTTHGPDGEAQLITQMFDAYAKPGAMFATVIDSYNAINFVRKFGPMFKERLIASGAKWLFRPDSGNAITMPVQIVKELEKVFGCTVNKKGYKVLNNVGVIQGDGIEPADITEIHALCMAEGYSAENIAAGMGGGLLQKNNRDTHKFALKCSAVRTGNKWIDVYKDPSVYDEDFNKLDVKSFKSSKKGRQELMYNPTTDEYKTVRWEESMLMSDQGWEVALETIYENGYMMRRTPFEEIRRNAGTII